MSTDNQQNQEKETALDTKEEKGNALTKRESSVGFSLQPKNLQEAMKICDYLAASSMVPKQYQGEPEDILVAINFGQEVGLKPLQSLNSVAVVNGTPSLWGDAPLALVKQHPDFEFILEDNEAFAYARDNVKGWEHLKNVNKDDTSICVVKRKDEPPTVREFSKQDVKQADLGNVHKSYPKIMRRYRARSQALKATFPDVLKGFEQAEIQKETQKMIDEGYYEDYTDVTDYASQEQPKADEREDVDISKEEGSRPEDTQRDPETTNGSSEQQGSTERKNDVENDTASPDPEPTTQGGVADNDERETIKAEVNELGKQVFGNTKWYSHSKAMAANVDENAEGIHQLDIEGLKHIKRQLQHKAQAEA